MKIQNQEEYRSKVGTRQRITRENNQNETINIKNDYNQYWLLDFPRFRIPGKGIILSKCKLGYYRE